MATSVRKVTMTHLDLFSGIGGFALAAKWAGFETVAFAEIDSFCSQVLKKHWPAVPNLGNVKDLMVDSDGNLTAKGETETLGNKIDLITGGFP